MKPLCLHFHIFKNAGATVDWALKRNFGQDALTFDDNVHRNAIILMPAVLAFLARYPNAKALSSHQMRLPASENSGYDFISMIFIRHPIDRVFSIYSYLRRIDRSDGQAGDAKNMPIKEFIASYTALKQNTTIKNFQTRRTGRHDDKIRLDENDFINATNNLMNCQVLGVVDRIDESLVVAEEVLRPYFPNIDMAYIMRNVSKERASTLDARLEEATSLIGNQLMQKLADNNRFDFRLYEFANKELDKKISSISNFDSRLANFKARCNELAEKERLRQEGRTRRFERTNVSR